ncbi:MAG TPA: TetR/AcrR family transcriptional regulator [Stellaceae bacterium]|jgi:AcrR family transcriptional regulator
MPETPARGRILRAAFEAFTEQGYAGTSTLDIATRAKVSKRELYALFGSKQAILVACIATRTDRMRPPGDLPTPGDRAGLRDTLVRFGENLLREASAPPVLAMMRLGVSEAERSPELARVLSESGRDATRATLTTLFTEAQTAGLVGPGDAAEIGDEYRALLWGDLMIGLLLRVADPPTDRDIARRAAAAADTVLRLHP